MHIKNIFLFFLIIFSSFLLASCTPEDQDAKEEQPQEPAAPGSETPTSPQTPSDSQQIPEDDTVIEPVEESDVQMISEARCVDNRIEAVLGNPFDDQVLIIGESAKVIINGLVVTEPECDSDQIGIRETVYCSDLTGRFAIKKGQTNRIQINMGSERTIADIICPEDQPEEDSYPEQLVED